MNYQEFKDYVAGNIKDYLPQKYQDASIEIREVNKNNHQQLDGLNVRPPEQNICPTIYLNHFYQEYEAGREITDIMENIAEIRKFNDIEKNFPVEELWDFEKIKDSVIFRVISAEGNQGILQEIPHRLEKDMALVYHIMLRKGEEGIATTQISKDMMQRMGVDENTLHEVALQNTPREFPMTFHSMDEVIREVMKEDFMRFAMDVLPDDDGMEEFLESLLEESFPVREQQDPAMYVLTNDRKINGAAVLFYPDVQEKLAGQMGGDYFVLPSSIHEVLIVPDQGEMDYRELKAMVNEVNETQVAPDEVLTGEVYAYDKESRQLLYASEKAERNHAAQKAEDKKPSIMDTLKEKKEEVMQNVSMGTKKAAEMEI